MCQYDVKQACQTATSSLRLILNFIFMSIKHLHKVSFLFRFLFININYRMHPIRIRESIQKGQKLATIKSQMNGFNLNGYQSTPRNLTSQRGNNNEFQKIITEVADRFQTALYQQNVRNASKSEMQIRDHHVLIQSPILSEDKQIRKKQIKIWLGQVCREVFSISFNYFSHKILDTQSTKAFSSQNFLGNIISLSKRNKLNQQDFQLMNLHLKNQILPYFLLRYPQSSSKEVNQKLNRQVSATDYLDTNQNNIFLKSKVKIQYRQNGIYYDKIMQFINYIVDLPARQVNQVSYATFYDDFNQRMQKLFTSVYNRKWVQTDFYSSFNNTTESVEQLRRKVDSLQQEIHQNIINKFIVNEIDKNISSNMSNNANDKAYQEKVKQYTKYEIARKISENVPKYTTEQIRHANLKILSPAILRIIIKWCTQLQQKFQNDYFLNRNQPFVMMNGEQTEMTDQLRQKLNQYAQKEWKQIKQFLKVIEYNIYQKQANLSYANLMHYSTQRYPQYEESILKFAKRNTQDVNHYAVCYLNRLIHGLMRMSNAIFFHLNGWAEWPYPPIFITFTISDLLRCRCVSKQKQIIRIYKQLQIQTAINPGMLRIVKVKNRLNKGTKDILLNLQLHREVLIQIQLAIKVDQSDFSLWSDKFNHYIYELQRSTYGPITEMSSIWSSIDQRSSLSKNEKIRVEEIQHTCSDDGNIQLAETSTISLQSQVDINRNNTNIKSKDKVEILPFTCSICYVHYSQARYIYDHHKCGKCNKFWVCALCRIKTLDEQSLIKQIKQKDKKLQITRRIPQGSEFPQYFISFQLQSIQAIGQKLRKFTSKNSVYFVRYHNGSLIVKQMKKADSSNIKKLFQRFIFFQTTKIDPDLQKLTLQDVINQLTINQIGECYKKRSQALRITRKNVTDELLSSICDPRAQYNMNSLIFPQNSINSLKQIGRRFPNLTMLNLNKNKIQSMEGVGQMTKLTDLYLGENKFKEIVELQNLTKLRYVQLGDNLNAPQFKCDLSKLNKLQSLTLIRSNLPKFPQEICSLTNLKLLWLFENNIAAIPKSINKLINLQYFHIEMNELTQLPQQLFQLIYLVKLMLSYNKLSQLSRSIQKLTNLELLTLQGMIFVQLPAQQIIQLPKLQCLIINKQYEPKFEVKNSTIKIQFK